GRHLRSRRGGRGGGRAGSVSDDQLPDHAGLLMAGDRAEELVGAFLGRGEGALSRLPASGLDLEGRILNRQVMLEHTLVLERDLDRLPGRDLDLLLVELDVGGNDLDLLWLTW